MEVDQVDVSVSTCGSHYISLVALMLKVGPPVPDITAHLGQCGLTLQLEMMSSPTYGQTMPTVDGAVRSIPSMWMSPALIICTH
ncbi:hypothetical protein DPMN_117957 [Dreissena polymorpha]|uniref:Uncharacterized protein n=1 Tax=Dreissena polymorpha TaxID=45954 RepID=A0A9D4JL86_DREPO|nr:hypothetical protein DPMN_117957 [Dreissena polymorpha]